MTSHFKGNFVNKDQYVTQQNTRHNYDDEIDLFELFQSIWKEKKLIAISIATTTLLALIYAFSSTPIYEVKSIIRPASIKDLDELNGTGIYKLDPEAALIQIGANLESYKTRLDFFKENPELFDSLSSLDIKTEQAFVSLSGHIKVLKSDTKKDTEFSQHVGLQLQYPKGMDGPAIVNGLIQHAINIEKQNISENIKVLISNKLERISSKIIATRAGYETNKESEIAQLTENDTLKKAQLSDELFSLREELKIRRQNRIQELDEAINIAKSLNIHKPATPSSLAKETRSSGNVIRTEVNSRQIPLYFMGTEALEAERFSLISRENDDFTSARIVEINTALKLLEINRKIEILKTREDDNLFLSGIAEYTKEITRLNSLRVDIDNLKLVRIDQTAIEPSSPIKPKKSLIVAVALVLGGMLGVFAALIRSMIRKRKLTDSEEAKKQ